MIDLFVKWKLSEEVRDLKSGGRSTGVRGSFSEGIRARSIESTFLVDHPHAMVADSELLV